MKIHRSLFSLLSILIYLGHLPGQEASIHQVHQQSFGMFEPALLAWDERDRPMDLIEREREPSHVVFGYHPYWNGTAYQNYPWEIISHIAWFGLAMSSNGGITNAHSWPWNDLVNMAHANGVKVIVTVTLFDNDDIATLLSSAEFRQNAIDNLISRVSAGNADGVNIDFESVPSGQESNFNTFINDLTIAFHDQIPNSETSIAMPAVDWWDSYDYAYLSAHCDGLMIMGYNYYWSGSSHAGPVAPLYDNLANYNIGRTIDDYLDETGNDGSNLILGLPWYGIDWPVSGTAQGAATTGSGSSIFYSSAEPNALTYGKHYSELAPSAWYNYTSGGNRQVWYDDSTSLATKYFYAINTELKGIGIWALGYDGGRPEMWGALSDAFGATAAPLGPQWFTVQNTGGGSVQVACAPVSYASEYELFAGTDVNDLQIWTSSANPAFVATGFEQDSIYYCQIRTGNSFGYSDLSEVLGVSITDTENPVLIVQGFERVSGTNNTFDYIKRHGPSIWAAGYGFDAASNDAVIHGAIGLGDYAMVDWISGEEATATVSFDGIEQDALEEYLEGGGRLFISGSEIGWDLEASGSTADIAFYHNYFKAEYVADDAASYSAYGTANGTFNGMDGLSFDNGNYGSYDVDYPDGIHPFGGSANNLRYTTSSYEALGGAGVQYYGPFGSSTNIGAIVYLSVGFEAFYPAATRDAIMSRVIAFLDPPVSRQEHNVRPLNFDVGQAFPNPFNGAITLPLLLETESRISIEVIDLRGRLLHSENLFLPKGENLWRWTGPETGNTETGVLLLRVSRGSISHTQKVTYLK